MRSHPAFGALALVVLSAACAGGSVEDRAASVAQPDDPDLTISDPTESPAPAWTPVVAAAPPSPGSGDDAQPQGEDQSLRPACILACGGTEADKRYFCKYAMMPKDARYDCMDWMHRGSILCGGFCCLIYGRTN
jgi:hypothetical protein